MRFSIVSYLDEATTLAVRALQRDLSDITGSKAALASWQPHVTVGDGVEVDEKQLDGLSQELQALVATQQVFALGTAGFGTFDTRPLGRGESSTPYVIYLEVILSEPLLELVERLYHLTGHYDTWYTMVKPYTPHITLAFRDLDAEGYQKGLAYIKGKSGRLVSTIDHVALVEKREDKDIEFRRFSFGSQNSA